MQGTAADEAFVEHARPDADSVGRGLEQPRHRRRGHLARRRRAVAAAAVARAHDGVLPGLDIDLEQSGAALAVGDIGLAAARTDTRIPRRFATLVLLPEPRAPGAPVSGATTLLAAPAAGARPVLPLAPAAVERLREHAASRAQPVELGLQRLDALGQRRVLALQSPRLGAQPGSVLAQRPDQRRGPRDRRAHPGVALAQPGDRALPGLHPAPGRRAQPVEPLAQRLGHALAPAVHPGDPRALPVEVPPQPVALVALGAPRAARAAPRTRAA